MDLVGSALDLLARLDARRPADLAEDEASALADALRQLQQALTTAREALPEALNAEQLLSDVCLPPPPPGIHASAVD